MGFLLPEKDNIDSQGFLGLGNESFGYVSIIYIGDINRRHLGARPRARSAGG
jgi:hypothetical protein